jgi:serine/arginine repetitive matrix protein 1
MSGGFFRGTSLDQDARFGNKQKKFMAKMKFPPCFDQKVYILLSILRRGQL